MLISGWGTGVAEGGEAEGRKKSFNSFPSCLHEV